MDTFIIDCPDCRARVAAKKCGVATQIIKPGDEGGPSGQSLYVGLCPDCGTPLAGESHQISWEGQDWQGDRWSDVVRIFPKPARRFSSDRIPKIVIDSLSEADKALQVGAYTAACVMLGRSLEALCRDVLQRGPSSASQRKDIMLAEGIRKLKEHNLIDERLFDWSEQLRAFRNMAAHPGDFVISRHDAEDLQTFAYAIVEYIYDLSDLYQQFRERLEEAKGQS